MTKARNVADLGSNDVLDTTSSGVDITGTITADADAEINGLTVGRGTGDVSTNTAVGSGALNANTTGSDNVAVGKSALESNTTGSNNVANGRSALYSNTTGVNNTANGYQALYYSTTGNDNTANGLNALVNNTTGSSNVANGKDSLYSNTTGVNNTAVGYQALKSNTTASVNVAVGLQALKTNTTGTYNTALGYQALHDNSTASQNTAVGYQALLDNSTGANNTAMGYRAGFNVSTGTGNTALGDTAAYNLTTGTNNVAIGANAGGTMTTADDNTFVGKAAGYLTTGSDNTFVGRNSGDTITTGSNNTIIGQYNGNEGGLDIRTSSGNVVLSDGSGNPLANLYSGGIFRMSGYNNNWWDGNFDTSDTDTIGVTLHRAGRVQIQAHTNSAGTEIFNCNNIHSVGAQCSLVQYRTRNITEGSIIGNGSGLSISNASDYRKKENITNLTGCLDTITSLRPVSYNLRSEYTTDTSEVHKGFIAHEVAEHMPNLVNGEKDAVDSDGNAELQSVMYTHNEMIATLVGAIKEQKEIIEALETRIETLENA